MTRYYSRSKRIIGLRFTSPDFPEVLVPGFRDRARAEGWREEVRGLVRAGVSLRSLSVSTGSSSSDIDPDGAVVIQVKSVPMSFKEMRLRLEWSNPGIPQYLVAIQHFDPDGHADIPPTRVRAMSAMRDGAFDCKRVFPMFWWTCSAYGSYKVSVGLEGDDDVQWMGSAGFRIVKERRG